MHSLPSVDGLMGPRRVFLTANPIPCSLVSSGGFPCQKKEKCLSLTDPESARLVSWRAMMSICSLLSSMLMTAVLRASLICLRLSEKPGVTVLMFHVPIFRAGVFFLFLMLGTRLLNHLSVFTLNPTHPLRLMVHGGAAPYWLGAAQLEAGSSCPVKCNGPSHRWKQPLAS